MTSPVHLRPRSIPELVDAAVPLLRRHYPLLATASVVLLGPSFALQLVLDPDDAWIGAIVRNLLLVMLDAATISIVSESYLGGTPDLASTLRTVGSRSGTLITATILRGLLIGVGLVVFLLPGVAFYAWSFAMPMVIMLEGGGATDALSRSNELVRGNTARVLLTLVLAFLVVFLLGVSASAALGTLGGAIGLPTRTITMLGQLSLYLAYPLGGIVGTLLYYDLRIRKEGFDLEVLAGELAA